MGRRHSTALVRQTHPQETSQQPYHRVSLSLSRCRQCGAMMIPSTSLATRAHSIDWLSLSPVRAYSVVKASMSSAAVRRKMMALAARTTSVQQRMPFERGQRAVIRARQSAPSPTENQSPCGLHPLSVAYRSGSRSSRSRSLSGFSEW
jgi:hypothetical protein